MQTGKESEIFSRFCFFSSQSYIKSCIYRHIIQIRLNLDAAEVYDY